MYVSRAATQFANAVMSFERSARTQQRSESSSAQRPQCAHTATRMRALRESTASCMRAGAAGPSCGDSISARHDNRSAALRPVATKHSSTQALHCTRERSAVHARSIEMISVDAGLGGWLSALSGNTTNLPSAVFSHLAAAAKVSKLSFSVCAPGGRAHGGRV